MKTSTKNRIATKAKISGLKLLSISTVIVPIAVVVYSNLEKYVGIVPEEVVAQTIRLTSGGIVAVGVAGLAVLGKIKLKFNWVLMGLLFGIFLLIQPIIVDLVLFTGIAFAGMTFDYVFINGTLESLKLYGGMKTEGLIHEEAKEAITKSMRKAEARTRARAEAKLAKETRYRP